MNAILSKKDRCTSRLNYYCHDSFHGVKVALASKYTIDIVTLHDSICFGQ